MAPIPVLYVDDETPLLDIGKLYLEKSHEFSVATAPSAFAALEHLKAIRVQAIVSDYQMPGMDGIEFLKKVRATDTRIPFIIFTGKGREEIAVEAFENGADFYVQKGGTPKPQFAELAVKIRAAVEKRTVEARLHESEVRSRALIQNSSEIIRILDTKGTIIYDSPSSERILGYPGGSLVGKKALDYIHPDDRKRVEEDIADVFGRRNAGVPTVFRIKKANGEYLPVESIATNHLNTPGIEGIVSTTRPVDALDSVKAALIRSEERFNQVTENAGEWIWEVDADGLYTYCSPAVEKILGFSPGELVNRKHFYDLFAPDVKDALTDVARAAFRKKRPFANFENPNLHKNGSTVILETSGTPILDARGTFTGYRGADLDITGRKRAEEALRLANKKLSLLSSITRHDILNQLLALRGYIDLSRDNLDNKQTLLEYLEKEDRAAKTIEHQIRFTKEYQEMGVAAPAWQNVDARIRSVLSHLPTRDVRIELDCTGLEVFADPLFDRVFYNLLDNALRHGGTQVTAIRVSSQESKTGLTLICEDDGTGITAEDKTRIFEKGFGKNSGLGLFLTREILGITGIAITENGVPGTGARFEITVPKGAYRIKGGKT